MAQPDRTETIKLIEQQPTLAGSQDIVWTIDRLLNNALRVHRDDAAGVAWVEGEYRGEWIELRVSLRPRPKTNDQPRNE